MQAKNAPARTAEIVKSRGEDYLEVTRPLVE